jgi:hypothetical protein
MPTEIDRNEVRRLVDAGAQLVEECACCDEPDCSVPICYRCLNVAVGQEMRHPHLHGG